MKRACLLVCLLFLVSVCFAKNTISEYQRTYIPVYTQDGRLNVALRVFKMNDVPSFLIVDLETLHTQVVPIALSRRIANKNKPHSSFFWNTTSTRYYQLLNKHTSAPYLLHNKGIRHASNAGNANVLSVDLCPSGKPFERVFFEKLVLMAEKNQKPTPVAIAITGMWMMQHPEEFQWLLAWQKEKKLDITWVNHSFSHVYYHDLPYAHNFLLRPETNMEAEILLTEQYLLEAGEVPSVFFRFPGLVSNKEWIKKIKLYGLIPLGTDAWMANLAARHEVVRPGGIILVHGNSNEHRGIIALMPLLDTLIWMDLKQAL